MVVQMGEGDHTWTETYAVEREVYDKIQEAEKNFRRTTNPTPKTKSKVTEEDEVVELDAIELEDSDLPFEDEVNEFIDDENNYSSDDILEEE